MANREKFSNKLAIGTVQFGLNYGISNDIGKIKFEEAKKIINLAKKSKISLIDTAASYGDSESRLGKIGVDEFKIVTKLPRISKESLNINNWLEDQLKHSFRKLRIKSLYGLLVHNSDSLSGKFGEKLANDLYKMKIKGLVKKIGISIYDPSELTKILNFFKPDIVQVPFSIFDKRFISSGLLSQLKKNKIEVHARSIFLQGLILMSENSRPSKFNKWNYLWKIWHEWLNDNKIKPLDACIRYACSIKDLDKIIVGINTKQQLEQIMIALEGKLPLLPKELTTDDINLLNPQNWKKL